MSILVTGGAGYIGSHSVVKLLEARHRVIVLDNLSNSNPEVLKRIERITGYGLKFVEGDILDKDKLESVFSDNEIEAVVHFAGLKAVGESVEMPLEYYHNNVAGTINLCQAMERYGVKNMVFSSSATVYGTGNPSPLKEDMPLSTTNPYGSTKLMIEQILRDIYASDNNWKIAILRYFNPIGAHGSGMIGENPKGIPNNLMPYITQVAVGKREKLMVFGDDYETPDGTGVRDYIHVEDLAIGHVKALKRLENSEGIHTYNLGTGKGYSVLDLVSAFENASGIKIRYEIADRRSGDIAECFADPAKALEELSWKAEKTLEDMCRDSWRWQKENPEGY